MKKNKVTGTITRMKDKVLNPFIVLAHEKLGLTPNVLTLCSLISGLVGVFLVLKLMVEWALLFSILAAFFDYLDGGVARKYDMVTKSGILYDKYGDKTQFFLLIASLAYIDEVSVGITLLLSFVVILLSVFEIFTGIGAFTLGWLVLMLGSMGLEFSVVFYLFILVNLVNFVGQIGSLFAKEGFFALFKPEER